MATDAFDAYNHKAGLEVEGDLGSFVESGAADDSDTADKTVQSIVIEADAKAVAAVVIAQSQTEGTIMGDGAPLRLD